MITNFFINHQSYDKGLRRPYFTEYVFSPQSYINNDFRVAIKCNLIFIVLLYYSNKPLSCIYDQTTNHDTCFYTIMIDRMYISIQSPIFTGSLQRQFIHVSTYLELSYLGIKCVYCIQFENINKILIK